MQIIIRISLSEDGKMYFYRHENGEHIAQISDFEDRCSLNLLVQKAVEVEISHFERIKKAYTEVKKS